MELLVAPACLSLISPSEAAKGLFAMIEANFGDALYIFSFYHLPTHKKAWPLQKQPRSGGMEPWNGIGDMLNYEIPSKSPWQ
jgi:hypothetical protein